MRGGWKDVVAHGDYPHGQCCYTGTIMSTLTVGGRFTIAARPPITKWVINTHGLGEADLTWLWALHGLHAWYVDERFELERIYKENNGTNRVVIPEIVRQLIVRVAQLIEIEHEIQALVPRPEVAKMLLENTDYLRKLREVHKLWPA